jgi:phenylpropionate dioxygenase-like ring-hydroxylating dioxygenase large terminal subunit
MSAAVANTRPGDWVKNDAMTLKDVNQLGMRTEIPTDRYISRDYAERERELVWKRVWQFVAREDELPEPGDWKTYVIYDQSYIVVRGKDGKIRGFVNACRHRGNILCRDEKGNTARFTCPYHLWSFDLEGQLRSVLRPDLAGNIADRKDEFGLLEVPVETFAGWVWLNPDVNAAPLADFFGAELMDLLAPYHLDQMVPVMDVRETIECNWKVVIDAFSEGYHIQGIHPELLKVIVIDDTSSRFKFFGDHSVAVAPFDLPHSAEYSPEEQAAGIRDLPATFPGTAMVLPAFDQLVEQYRQSDGTLVFPDGITGRTLLQQATRTTLAAAGLDVSGLTDEQMSDNQGWLLFPNFFMTVRAGECHIVSATPHPDGDPNRCIWHVSSYMWFPSDMAAELRQELIDVREPGSHEYFLALQQDYDQMPRQQLGLRNSTMKFMATVDEEVIVQHFEQVVDEYMARA